MSHYSHQRERSVFKLRDVKHVGVTATGSGLVGLEHAEAVSAPPLGIFNVTTFDTEQCKKFRGGLSESTAAVEVM